MTAPPRIFKVTYRSGLRYRNAETYMKVPYGGLFGMSEVLSRMLTTGQILWFRIDVAKPGEITPDIRAGLERWMPALTHTSHVTGVDWTS